jgi:hypothetical protein
MYFWSSEHRGFTQASFCHVSPHLPIFITTVAVAVLMLVTHAILSRCCPAACLGAAGILLNVKVLVGEGRDHCLALAFAYGSRHGSVAITSCMNSGSTWQGYGQ